MSEKQKLWNRDLAGKGDVILAVILRALFLVAFVVSLIRGEWYQLAAISASIALTFIPVILERSFKVSIPASFQIVLLLFIFNAQFLGELYDFYERFWWWDLLLHGSSGVLLGVVGFLLIYILNEAKGVSVVMSPFFIAFFALCFAVTCGVFWEVFEYLMDVIFGTNMQKSGLDDTMGDLLIDTAGGLIAAVTGYFTLVNHKRNALSLAVFGFLKKNPSMAKRLEEQREENRQKP